MQAKLPKSSPGATQHQVMVSREQDAAVGRAAAISPLLPVSSAWPTVLHSPGSIFLGFFFQLWLSLLGRGTSGPLLSPALAFIPVLAAVWVPQASLVSSVKSESCHTWYGQRSVMMKEQAAGKQHVEGGGPER